MAIHGDLLLEAWMDPGKSVAKSKEIGVLFHIFAKSEK